ncbi:hypothetical protein ACFLWD_02005 [Chloroflexota bacterium]
MSELIPKDLPKGKDLVQEGIKIGENIELGKSPFLQKRNVRCENDWKRMQAEKGNIQWNPILGLGSVDEQVEGLKYLWEWSKKVGLEFDRCDSISSRVTGLPLDMRNKAPKETAFIFEDPNDWVRIAQASPMALCILDHHIGSPNAVYNTTNALKAGATTVGLQPHIYYNYPYWHDDITQVVETVKAIGIMASKRKDGIMLSSQTGDGIEGQFFDHVSQIGFNRLQQYITEDLCGASYCTGLGGSISGDVPTKMAIGLALHDILKANQKTDHNVWEYVVGNTLEASKDIESNYALIVAEFIPFAILERKYKTGCAYMANPVTEYLRVPTVKEITDAFSVCAVALRKAKEYEKAKMFDDSHINEIRSLLLNKGNQFFENLKKGLSEMGVDITDPVQIFLATRRLGAAKLEEMCHPGERDSTYPGGFIPFVPAEPIRMAMKTKDDIVKKVYSEQLGDVVRDKKVVIGSTDIHIWGLFVVSAVLKDLGAKVVNGGIDLDVEQVLDLAFKEDTPYIAMSTNNGMCLDWCKHLMRLAKQRNQPIKAFMGGRLNTILEGATEPVDVSDQLVGLGVIPCQEVNDLIKGIASIQT